MGIKETFIYKFLKEYYLKIVVSCNPKKEIDRCYYKVFHRHCDLNNPHDLIEKIFWMELNADTSMWTLCADKYRVREYVDSCGLIDYMPQLYGHWDNADDIDLSNLPPKFVVKSNNGCGTVMIVKDKSKLNMSVFKRVMKQWLITPYGYTNASLHYTKIKPCIIAEELVNNDYVYLSSISLVDFKVWCFNGQPEWIFVAYNRKPSSLDVKLYDCKWVEHPEHLSLNQKHYIYNPSDYIEKPTCLDDMLDIAKRLSTPFPEVRVDFYIANGKPVIGELTFSSGYGYFTEDFYKLLGERVDLSMVKTLDGKPVPC